MAAREREAINRDLFERLLGWLDSDRNRAGEKYEQVRLRLIKIFEARGCPVADELADATLDRVAGKLQDIVDTYVGKPELYFYGVAQNIYLEYLRRKTIELPEIAATTTEEAERQYECLDECLQRLTPKNRRVVLQYYQERGHTQMETRKNLARRLGIGPNALRIRVHRIREALAGCLVQCLRNRNE